MALNGKTIDFLEGDMRGVIDHFLSEGTEPLLDTQEVIADRLRAMADELEAGEYAGQDGFPFRHLDATDAHGRFGGNVHYRLIQASLHKIIDRYYEKNAKIGVENESLSFRSSLGSGSLGGYGNHYSEKELHPDIVVTTEPGEAGMSTSKTIIVECETRNSGLLKNDLRMASYHLLRLGNPDKNELMIYISVPESLRGKFDKPDWVNDFWYFDVGAE